MSGLSWGRMDQDSVGDEWEEMGSYEVGVWEREGIHQDELGVDVECYCV
jgi:hypothetical protein